jgi:hypothetical protein
MRAFYRLRSHVLAVGVAIWLGTVGDVGAQQSPGPVPEAPLPEVVVNDSSLELVSGLFGRDKRVCPFGRWRDGNYVPVEEGAPTAPVTPG